MPLDPEAWKLASARLNGSPKSNGAADVAEARRIILERNGIRGGAQLGASTIPIEQARALQAMQTNTQARHVLGIVAKHVSNGYQVIQTFPFATGVAKKQAIELLDRNRGFAEKIYAGIPDNTAPVSPQLRKNVTVAVTQAASSLALISSAANNLNQSMMADVVDFLIHRVKSETGWAPPKWLIWGGVAVGGAIGAYLLWKVVSGVMLRDAALGEAEAAAVSIAEAQARKRRQKQLYSIS
jgi:hypothetical protein